MKLTEHQEETVRSYVENQQLKLKTLRDDIIDHLCCVIESQMGKDKTFEELLMEAMRELAPNGLHDLENKTLFLLNSKRILIMRKLTYLIGFFGAAALIIGAVFKIFHFPAAMVIQGAGTLLILLFLPLLALDKYKVAVARSMSDKVKWIVGILSASFILLGGVTKQIHLPGSGLLLAIGMLVFAIGFLPFVFLNMYKKSEA